MKCDWCEQPIMDRPIRLANSQPPWKMQHVMAAVGSGIGAAIRAAGGEPEIELWFHRNCWHSFVGLLRGDVLFVTGNRESSGG